jgi:hypothetical protein
MFNNPSAYAQDMLLMGYSNFWSPIFCKDKILLFNRILRGWKLEERDWKLLFSG